VSAIDSQRRTIWIVDGHRDEKRFVVWADEELTAFVKLESAIRSRMDMTALRYPSNPLNSHQRISAAGAGTRVVR
jgi:hypothetical protein